MEPIIAGIEKSGKPFVASMDLIGCTMVKDDFVVGGTCTEQMYGMCESLFRPNMVGTIQMNAIIYYNSFILVFTLCQMSILNTPISA